MTMEAGEIASGGHSQPVGLMLDTPVLGDTKNIQTAD